MAIRNTLGGPETQFLICWGQKAPAAATEGRNKKRLDFPEVCFLGGKKRLRQLRRVEKRLDLVPGPVSGYQKPVSGYQKPVLDPRTGPKTLQNTQVGHQVGGQNRDTQFLIAVFLIASWGGVSRNCFPASRNRSLVYGPDPYMGPCPYIGLAHILE